VPETCWASNKICNKKTLLHLVGILFPHINDDARSKPHQIQTNLCWLVNCECCYCHCHFSWTRATIFAVLLSPDHLYSSKKWIISNFVSLLFRHLTYFSALEEMPIHKRQSTVIEFLSKISTIDVQRGSSKHEHVVRRVCSKTLASVASQRNYLERSAKAT